MRVSPFTPTTQPSTTLTCRDATRDPIDGSSLAGRQVHVDLCFKDDASERASDAYLKQIGALGIVPAVQYESFDDTRSVAIQRARRYIESGVARKVYIHDKYPLGPQSTSNTCSGVDGETERASALAELAAQVTDQAGTDDAASRKHDRSENRIALSVMSDPEYERHKARQGGAGGTLDGQGSSGTAELTLTGTFGSDGSGKTLIKSGPGAVVVHPGMGYTL
jgi:hypothetical protein